MTGPAVGWSVSRECAITASAPASGAGTGLAGDLSVGPATSTCGAPAERWAGHVGLRVERGAGAYAAAYAALCGAVPRCGPTERPSGMISPVSSKRITPLQRRLQPCSGEGRDDARGVVVEGVGGRTGRLMLTHRIGHFLYFSGGGRVDETRRSCCDSNVPTVCSSCEVTHMTKNARYPAERRSFEQVTLKLFRFGS